MNVRTAVAAVLLTLGAWIVWLRLDLSGTGTAEPAASSPAEARQRQLLHENVGRPGDPDLGAAYQRIDAKHFAGALPAMPVRWESQLADVGALAAQAFTLDGMYGRVGRRQLILLNPSLQSDPAAVTRALCHEMVHAYLFASGDHTTNHGSTFKAVLQRLSAEGAFEGIPASDEDKVHLRAWLDDESARLDSERAAVDASRPEVTPESAAAFNDRIERDRSDLAHFNAEVARYNLMIVYPDGLDDGPMPAAPASAGALRR